MAGLNHEDTFFPQLTLLIKKERNQWLQIVNESLVLLKISQKDCKCVNHHWISTDSSFCFTLYQVICLDLLVLFCLKHVSQYANCCCSLFKLEACASENPAKVDYEFNSNCLDFLIYFFFLVKSAIDLPIRHDKWRWLIHVQIGD